MRHSSKSGSARTSSAVPIGQAPLVARLLVATALAVSLVLLLVHAWAYRFQCDDAFISFRYARNFAHGYGLVFNPGPERVEGYTNFLWVLLLSGFARLGIPPERAADPLSLLATVMLWGLVVSFAWRGRGRLTWAVVVPALLLAATRSVAVWATSGLETRLFEVLCVAGVLRLAIEVEAALGGSTTRRPFAGVLFALATLTRPDGMLVAASTIVAGGLVLGARRRLDRAWLIGTLVPFTAIVGAHVLFRRLYYGAWLPNTFYAKIDGRHWWTAGASYLEAFGLEYAVYLWIPLIAIAVAHHVRRGTGYVPLLFAAAVVPHALYIAGIGGDHFEYRPLDAYFPFAFLLVGDGLEALSRRRGGAAMAAAALGLVLVGLWELPWQSHRQFPPGYRAGFPGLVRNSDYVEADDYLDPSHDPVFGNLALRPIAAAYQNRIRYLTSHYVGVRQEEHRMFLATAIAQARLLDSLMTRGVLPRDLYVAISCVGAIPYYTNLRTLDRHGLTDARVAHSRFVLLEIMAHGKYATLDYARARGVDLWAMDPVNLVVPVTSKRLLVATRDSAKAGEEVYAAPVGEGQYLLCSLPQGVGAASRRVPTLRFQFTRDADFIRRYIDEAAETYRSMLRKDPQNLTYWRRLAFFILARGEYQKALALYQHLAEMMPQNGEIHENLGLAQEYLGDTTSAAASFERALAIARARGNAGDEQRLERLAGEAREATSASRRRQPAG